MARARSIWLLVLPLLAAAAWLLWSGGKVGDSVGNGKRTIVLFTIDTLRRDHVSHYAPEGIVPPASTPHLDRLATEGLCFLDAS